MLVLLYINSTNILPIMIINRIYEHQNLLSLLLVFFLVGLRTYQHPCTISVSVLCLSSDLRFIVVLLCVCLPYTLHNLYLNLPHNKPAVQTAVTCCLPASHGHCSLQPVLTYEFIDEVDGDVSVHSDSTAMQCSRQQHSSQQPHCKWLHL